MAGLKWTLKAVGDLELIFDYIAADSQQCPVRFFVYVA